MKGFPRTENELRGCLGEVQERQRVMSAYQTAPTQRGPNCADAPKCNEIFPILRGLGRHYQTMRHFQE